MFVDGYMVDSFKCDNWRYNAMSTYANDGDKINTAALCASLDYDQDAQPIERGKIFGYVNDLVGFMEEWQNEKI